MNLYEGLFLLDPADAAANWNDLQTHVTGILENTGCELVYSEKWPDRRLAYDIKGRSNGTYFLTFFRTEGDKIENLRQEVNISERILRLLLLRSDLAMEAIEQMKENQHERAMQSMATESSDDDTESSGDGSDDEKGDSETEENDNGDDTAHEEDAGKNADEDAEKPDTTEGDETPSEPEKAESDETPPEESAATPDDAGDDKDRQNET